MTDQSSANAFTDAAPAAPADAAAFVMWEWDAQADVLRCQGDEQLLNALPTDSAGLLAAVHPDDRPALEQALRAVAAGGRSFELECRAANDGWLLIRARSVASNGDSQRVLGMVVDAAAMRAERERLAAQAAQCAEDAATARADFDFFSYAVSHDLRAPLRAIGGFSEVLLESEPGMLEDSARQYLPRIVTATHRMSQLLDDLLQLSRFNRAELHPQHVDLAEVAREVALALNDTQPPRLVSFAVPETAPAWGDPDLLRAVLQRLLDNAWKFTAHTSAPAVEVGYVAEENTTTYYVRDNGAGFDPANADRLFQPLQRLHRADEFEGSGVGLTIVKRIIDRHGGSVWAEGSPDQGACFWFRLPNPPTDALKPA